MGLRAQGRFGLGLAEELAGLLQKLGETGASPLRLLPDSRAALEDDARARRELARALEALRAAFASAGREAPPAPGPLLYAYSPGELPQAFRELRRCSPMALRAQGADKEAI